ncbi:MAG: hypothetical protein B6I22_13285 [Desulfobacteraceae bacterium 4572_123]|nr:MAG: hypothetical protein B6I22_13285 [Desulfobacteraceae bacterium 4572_123]
MKLTALFLSLFFVAGILPGSPVLVSAYRPPIVVNLQFSKDKPHYGCNDRVAAIITVANTSYTQSIRISRDSFSRRRLFFHLRIIDPAGRLLIPGTDAPRHEAFHAPPLPFVMDPVTRKLVVSAPCEMFKAEPVIRETMDLGRYYNFELSGQYSAQVQLSLMVFEKDGVCSPQKYRWLGVLKSEPQHFSVAGRLPIQIHPVIWHLDWKDRDPGRNVVIRLPIPAGSTVRDFKKEIRLKNLEGLKADADRVNGMLQARFRGRLCIERLKNVRPGYSYRIVVSGQYANGRPFCASQRITIQ